MPFHPERSRIFRTHNYTEWSSTKSKAIVTAVQEYPIPLCVHDLRQFLRLTLYYRLFIPQFAKVALQLTCKDTEFLWLSECYSAFEELKRKLVSSPVLAYPRFEKDFVLETDASARGLATVLSQIQSDENIHPIAYASRALPSSEKNCGITDLETSAIVWALSHFHYCHSVTVYTDHFAVKAVLETSNKCGKHAKGDSRSP